MKCVKCGYEIYEGDICPLCGCKNSATNSGTSTTTTEASNTQTGDTGFTPADTAEVSIESSYSMKWYKFLKVILWFGIISNVISAFTYFTGATYQGFEDELYEMLLKRKQEYGMLENNEFLTGLFAKMLSYLIIRNCKLDLSGYAETLTFKEIKRIVEEIKSFKLEPKGFYSFDKAQVTVGGIETNELDKKTLEIKKMPGAYACGEVLNIDGECGGYNIHWALASGYTVALDIISKCEE